jgi:hypothetical protein
MSSNIIPFPKQKIIKNENKEINIEEVIENVETAKQFHIQETLSTILPILFNQIELSGFYSDTSSDEDDEKGLLYGVFIVESIKAMLSKHYNIHHPFQNLINNIFIKDESSGTYKLVDKINVSLEKHEDFEVNIEELMTTEDE